MSTFFDECEAFRGSVNLQAMSSEESVAVDGLAVVLL